MTTLTLMIIRHAEKPKESWPGDGLTIEGDTDHESLVIRGWQRSGAWAALFGSGLDNDRYPIPDVIYAANPSPPTAGDNVSQRPYETVTPLGDKLGKLPLTTFALDDETQLVAAIKGLTGVVLVCWEHKAIIKAILPAIVGNAPPPGLPTKWDGTRFDVVLRFDREASDKPWKFKQLFPMLLSGDSDKDVDKPVEFDVRNGTITQTTS